MLAHLFLITTIFGRSHYSVVISVLIGCRNWGTQRLTLLKFTLGCKARLVEVGSKTRQSGSMICIPNHLPKWLKHFCIHLYWMHCLMVEYLENISYLFYSFKTLHPPNSGYCWNDWNTYFGISIYSSIFNKMKLLSIKIYG